MGLHDLYRPRNGIVQLQEDEKDSACGTVRKDTTVWEPEGKRQFGRRRHRWEDSMKHVLKNIGFEGVKGINLGQDGDRRRPVFAPSARPVTFRKLSCA